MSQREKKEGKQHGEYLVTERYGREAWQIQPRTQRKQCELCLGGERKALQSR